MCGLGQANSGNHQLPINFPDFLLAPSTCAAQLAGGRCILGDVFVLLPNFGAGSSPCLSWHSQSQDHRAQELSLLSKDLSGDPQKFL